MSEMYASKRLTEAELIGKVILKAATAKGSRTRYAHGFMARRSLFMRKWISDKMFDRVVSSMAQGPEALGDFRETDRSEVLREPGCAASYLLDSERVVRITCLSSSVSL
jgi:hypothetical protein